MDDITNLNEIIYDEVKLFRYKIVISKNNPTKMQDMDWEFGHKDK